MKNILFIELCNFTDYPLGGHLSFATHLATAMQGDIDLVGIRTDTRFPERTWSKIELCGHTYNFFNVKNIALSFKKPLIPSRVSSFFQIKRCIRQVLFHKDYDLIIVQTPEVLLSMPKSSLKKVCLIMPGVGNPLEISRYTFFRRFAKLYDKLFFSYVKHVKIILPAADKEAIQQFIVRSCNCVTEDKVKQFPTRYDATLFKMMDKQQARSLLHIPENELMLVTTGRLNWFKGWKFLIDSFLLFKKNHAQAKLYFIGKGEDELKIREYISELSLDESVILAGVHPLPVVARYLQSADLFVMGSFFEGWSTALVEAVACAVPCVVTEFSSAHDLVKDGENGFVLTNRNEHDYVVLLEKALKLDFKEISSHAFNAYQKMSVQTMRSQLNDILDFES